jgi:hypothetical protein
MIARAPHPIQLGDLPMPRQYHFDFPSERRARRFAQLVVWHLREDVATCLDGCSVVVVDAGARDRSGQLLDLAVRLNDPGA